mmetsp:Transcript_107734/g.347799  ORF Transcript_107734/g.347799 Transcript_107734/m.347799 type:complete len:211 (+) Transcript_107734:388-1020(+)
MLASRLAALAHTSVGLPTRGWRQRWPRLQHGQRLQAPQPQVDSEVRPASSSDAAGECRAQRAPQAEHAVQNGNRVRHANKLHGPEDLATVLLEGLLPELDICHCSLGPVRRGKGRSQRHNGRCCSDHGHAPRPSQSLRRVWLFKRPPGRLAQCPAQGFQSCPDVSHQPAQRVQKRCDGLGPSCEEPGAAFVAAAGAAADESAALPAQLQH